MVPTPPHEPVKVFISYSHKDERFREQLQEHLFAAKRQGLIEDWHDRRIAPGEEWEDLISENLETSDIILLLVSSSFIASPYCYDKEMKRALEKHEAGQARVIPIILRPVDWSEAPFARLQALPRNVRPVSKWSNRDEAWMDVAKGIRAAVKQLRSERQPDTPELIDDEEEEEEFASQHREVLDSARPWEYVDFDLNIEEGSEPRKYPTSARSPEGEARAEMRFPFDEWQLKDKLRDLEVALLRSGGTRRGLGTAEEQTVREFGQALFEALFADEIRVSYETSLHEARRQGKGLRLKLHVLPPELSALPWEFIYEPEGDYLALSSTTPLVRYLDLPQPVERLAVSPPLRILGMVASPQGLPSLDVDHEKRLMEEAVKRLRAERLVELQWLEGHTWRELQRAMRSGPWHIFHFVGHGGFDPATEEGAIALSDEEGRKDLLRARSLARLLDDHFPLRLVFLNSCEGAKGSERDAFSSIAATLVRYGVPAVVAMQYEITDTAAIEFARNFYEAVADGLPVDAAATEARTAVSMKSALEWGTPVLFMRSTDGRIFDISAPEESERQAAREAKDRQGEARLAGLSPSGGQGQAHDEHPLLTQADQDEQPHQTTTPDGARAREQEERQQQRRGGPRKRLIAAVVLGALALIGLVAVIVLWPSSPKVPDVVGQTESEAERRVGHDYDIYVRSVRVDSLPKGIIMSQDPKAGETAELGSTISVVVSAGQPPEPGDIFQDDFSDTSSGWDLHKFSEKEGERYTIEYVIGRLRVYDAPDASSWTYAHTLNPTAPTAIEDAIVEVDGTVTTNASESSDTAGGIICRALDYENLYALGISSDGRPSIWKLKDNERIPLATGSPSDAFRDGSAKNHLRADCLGSKLTLYANNRMVLKAEDSEFKSGMIGLYVEEHGEGTDILFDNFLVSSP